MIDTRNTQWVFFTFFLEPILFKEKEFSITRALRWFSDEKKTLSQEKKNFVSRNNLPYSISFNFFINIGINKLLYPYASKILYIFGKMSNNGIFLYIFLLYKVHAL